MYTPTSVSTSYRHKFCVTSKVLYGDYSLSHAMYTQLSTDIHAHQTLTQPLQHQM